MMGDDFFLIGSQWAQKDGPILFIRVAGHVTVEDEKALLRNLEEIKREFGRCYLLFDASAKASHDPEARGYSTKHYNSTNKPDCVAVFGATFANRVLVTLFSRAIKLLARIDLHVEFFSTEAEARDFLLRLDQRFGTGQKSSGP